MRVEFGAAIVRVEFTNIGAETYEIRATPTVADRVIAEIEFAEAERGADA